MLLHVLSKKRPRGLRYLKCSDMFAAMMRQSKILGLLVWGLATTGCVSSGKYDGVVADLKT